MLILKDNFNNISVTLEGTLKRLPNIRGLIKTETAIGIVKSEGTKGVINLALQIKFLSEAEYRNLEYLFLCMSTFEVIDTDTGMHYVNYFFEDSELELDKLEDIKSSVFYYEGNLRLNKR